MSLLGRICWLSIYIGLALRFFTVMYFCYWVGGGVGGGCQETTTGEQAKIQVSVRTFVHVAAYCSL